MFRHIRLQTIQGNNPMKCTNDHIRKYILKFEHSFNQSEQTAKWNVREQVWTECANDLLEVKVKKLSRQQLKAGKEMTTWKEVCDQKLHYATIENISSVRINTFLKRNAFNTRFNSPLTRKTFPGRREIFEILIDIHCIGLKSHRWEVVQIHVLSLR